MLFFDMSDFMGNNGIDFFGLKQPQQGRGDQYVTEFFDQPHHAGGDHFTAEDGPVENICIGQAGLAA